MNVTAELRYCRMSPKKIKVWGAAIVGLAPQIAVDRLSLSGNKAAKILQRLVVSAMANARNNAKLDITKIKVQSVEILKGPAFKRFQPVSRGMAHQIKKKTSHIKVVLHEIEGEKLKPVEIKKEQMPKEQEKASERSITNGTKS